MYKMDEEKDYNEGGVWVSRGSNWQMVGSGIQVCRPGRQARFKIIIAMSGH